MSTFQDVTQARADLALTKIAAGMRSTSPAEMKAFLEAASSTKLAQLAHEDSRTLSSAAKNELEWRNAGGGD